jgi:AraC-like DNA-binding protein
MVSTIEIPPSPVLLPYVRCFSLREFDTMGQQFIKPLHAQHEFYITFHLNNPPISLQEKVGKNNNLVTSLVDKYVIGLQSYFTGSLSFCGHIRFFSIQFWPTGFFGIFNKPLTSFTNMVFDATDIFNYDFSRLLQQLQEATNFNQMVAHAEKLLLTYLNKSKTDDPYHAMQTLSKLIYKDAGNKNINIDQLAYDANMSIKTFERKFLQQIGLSPKLFARIVRFNKVINSKMQNPKQDWTSIAYDFGYYDQMHLIRDFKEFANDTPISFFKNTPPPVEEVFLEENK